MASPEGKTDAVDFDDELLGGFNDPAGLVSTNLKVRCRSCQGQQRQEAKELHYCGLLLVRSLCSAV